MLFGKPSRRMWIAAIAVSLLCVGALVFALVTHWNAAPEPLPAGPGSGRRGGGLGLGIGLGVGVAIVIASLIAARRKST